MNASLRCAILERDRFTCRYCGRRAPEVALHVDHVEPRSVGGADSFENLVTACQDCNLGKRTRTSRPAISFADRLARAEATAERAWDAAFGEQTQRIAMVAVVEQAQDAIDYLRYALRAARSGYRSEPTRIGETIERRRA